jgi:hypothetical protein
MCYRQFMWGLSNGVLVLAVAGAFWFGVGAFNRGFVVGPAALIAAGTAALVSGSATLRRKSGGFRFAELKLGNEAERLETRRIQVGFRWTTIGETLLVGSAFGICNGVGRQDLIWPAVGIAVSLHFVALGYLFHLRPYFATAALGCVVSLVAITQGAATSMWIVGAGMGSVLWATAAFAILSAEALADQAVSPSR